MTSFAWLAGFGLLAAPAPAFDFAPFWKHWGDGQAEISTYRLVTPRYGEKREGQAVLIYVTEDMSDTLRVKADPGKHPASDVFPALKLNHVRSFQAGIYDYRIMTSTFARVAQGFPVAKISFTSQEWCGQVYHQLLPRGASIESVSHSYFDGEADATMKLPMMPAGVLEDQLWILLRDLLNEDFDSVIVDTPELYQEARNYVLNIAPDKEKIVKLHQGKVKVFEQLGLEKQLKMLFGRSVSLPQGGYLIVEHTEALHVIDVNSGNKSNSEADQEATALSVNREAAKEIARQLRLRDMGGIIVIDFIDMKKAENKKAIQDIMKDEMRTDRSKYTILPLTKFGLMQITRQRVRPEMNVITAENCPTCGGTGKITASIAISDIIEHHLEHILQNQNEKKPTIIMHPFLFAYFTKGFPSIRMKWYFKYKTWVNLITDTSFGITDFKFLYDHNEPIELIG